MPRENTRRSPFRIAFPPLLALIVRKTIAKPPRNPWPASLEADPESNLAASAVSGQAPPARPQWVRGLAPLEPHALSYDKPLCVSLDGFTLHAATRAGGHDAAGREARLR